MTFLSGQTLTAAALNAEIFDWRPAYARKTADQTQSATVVLLNDTHLFVPLVANYTYAFKLNLIYEAGTAADYRWAFTFPTGCTVSWVSEQLDSALAYQPAATSGYVSGNATGLGGAGIGTPRGAVITGNIVVGSTAGNLQYQWAQLSSIVENTKTSAGSDLILKRLA